MPTQPLPRRTIESTRPTPGTVSPGDTLRMPSGPANTAVPPKIARIVHPSMVFCLLSAFDSVDGGPGELFAAAPGARRWTGTAGLAELVFCCAADGAVFVADTLAS